MNGEGLRGRGREGWAHGEDRVVRGKRRRKGKWGRREGGGMKRGRREKGVGVKRGDGGDRIALSPALVCMPVSLIFLLSVFMYNLQSSW